MKMTSNTYYVLQDEKWTEYRIAISFPERGAQGADYFCRVNVNGDHKDVFGIDELQALVLGVYHVQSKLRELVKAGTNLYFSKSIDQKMEIELSLLCDYSKYLANSGETTSK